MHQASSLPLTRPLYLRILLHLTLPVAEAGAVLHVVTAARVTGAYTGESERRLREVFAAAQADADAGRVAVVFLDEVGRGGWWTV